MGLGDIIDDERELEEETKEEDEEVKPKVDQEDPTDKIKEIRDSLFLNEFCEDLGIVVEPPKQKEFVSRGSEVLEEPLPEGYVDCTDRVEFILSDSKYMSCPHCPDDELMQKRGSGCRRSDTWARCGGCSRILVDLETDNRDGDGDIVEQSGIDSWL